jgi:transposase
MEARVSALGQIKAFGVKGTGSYGAGLSHCLLAMGYTVLDVMRPNRQLRYLYGKSDSLDAEGAARSLLNAQATAVAKTQTGSVEMIRYLKVARDNAVKIRSQAIVTLKTLNVNAPTQLRDCLEQIKGQMALIRHIAAMIPGEMTTPTISAKTAMRVIARPFLFLHAEIRTLDQEFATQVELRAPTLVKAHGIGPMTATEMLILAGDNNPERIKSEAALANICGVCPIPASSGKTNRMRLNRGGNRQASAALCRVAIVRMQGHEATQSYIARRPCEGKSKREIIRCMKRYLFHPGRSH